MAGRLSKPNLIIKCNNEFKKAIDANRKMALWTGACLKGSSGLVRDLYVNISKFSYLGDIRNGIKIFGKTFLNHENPNKIYNLVDGSFQEYENIFSGKNAATFAFFDFFNSRNALFGVRNDPKPS